MKIVPDAPISLFQIVLAERRSVHAGQSPE